MDYDQEYQLSLLVSCADLLIILMHCLERYLRKLYFGLGMV